MKYQANPVIVDAYKIVSVSENLTSSGGKELAYDVALDNGTNERATESMCSRYAPKADDYWVVQSDGYVYLNPKEVFERKYSPLEMTSEKAA